jgi:hypothetical protein
MSFADQPYADESDANAFVRAENILVSRRAENPRASGLHKAAPVFHIIILLKQDAEVVTNYVVMCDLCSAVVPLIVADDPNLDKKI